MAGALAPRVRWERRYSVGEESLPRLGEQDREVKRLARNNASRYYSRVIRSFRDRETARLFERQPARRLPPDIQRVALRKLRQLDAAVDLADLRVPPGNRLERLVGNRAGQYSIRINDQWRICFRWQAGDAYDVAIADYH